MLLLYNSHKQISYPIRTIARSAIFLNAYHGAPSRLTQLPLFSLLSQT
ncbi:hypothetical protein OZD68_00090 [Wolbachia endosymbiont of Drosophila bicornuta]|nr:hypothetical protein [Wolbachia endosymbiont of Drosophila bicornuta]MDE5056041.1 hypothetical protein [Wolbachia endosymbiont of Drosophila bicornuta]